MPQESSEYIKRLIAEGKIQVIVEEKPEKPKRDRSNLISVRYPHTKPEKDLAHAQRRVEVLRKTQIKLSNSLRAVNRLLDAAEDHLNTLQRAAKPHDQTIEGTEK